MKTGRLMIGLGILTCLIPLYFFGSSYLMHEHRVDLQLPPYPVLALWTVAALCLYRLFVYRAATWCELARFVLFCAVLGTLMGVGVAAGYWTVVSVYGE